MKRNVLFASTLFALSMGFFESAIVVYLRALAYPGGFSFPLHPLSEELARTELFRELASMVMLLAFAWLISKRRTERLAWFVYNFAIWDLSYYLFLKILLGWPESLLTPDILFLIPVAWTGPVAAPVLLSLLMIVFASIVLKHNNDWKRAPLSRTSLALLVSGSFVVILSFIVEYLVFFFQTTPRFVDLFKLEAHQQVLNCFVPDKFSWYLFATGFVIICTGIIVYSVQTRKKRYNYKKQILHPES